MRTFGVTPTFEPVDTAWLVAGRAARVVAGGETLGTAGLLAAAVADAHDVPRGDAVFVVELDLDRLGRAGAARFHPRRAAAALPVGRARRIAPRARHLVCRHRS